MEPTTPLLPVPAEPPVPPEIGYVLAPYTATPVERALPWSQRLREHPLLRRSMTLTTLALLWEALARWTDNDLLLPTFTATAAAFAEGVASGETEPVLDAGPALAAA
jgi:NitT/TauT family transport system permease protein